MSSVDEPRRPSGPVAHSAADAELEAVRALVVQIDKTFRTVRTYGRANHLTDKFFLALHHDLDELLKRNPKISLLVQRFELIFEGRVVYERPSRQENLAFKLYADGVRELSLGPSVQRADLEKLLEILSGDYDHVRADEDIVTRLWEENLPGVALVTADEIISAGDAAQDVEYPEGPDTVRGTRNVGGVDDAAYDFESVPGAGAAAAGEEVAGVERKFGQLATGGRAPSLADLHRLERDAGGVPGARVSGPISSGAGGGGFVGGGGGEGGSASARQARHERGVGGTATFEVSAAELEALRREVEAENDADHEAFVVEVLFAAVGADDGPRLPAVADLMSSLFELVVERGELSRARGVWHALRSAAPSAAKAEEVERVHKALAAIAGAAWRPSLERFLNAATTPARVEGLPELLAELGHEAVSELCELLATLSRGEHRLAVCDALTRIGRTHAEALVPRLSDPRPNLLRGLLVVLERLGKPELADALAPLMKHESREVRIEAVRAFHTLRSAGPAAALMDCLADDDATVRHEALRALTGNTHTVPATAWPELVESPAFMERAETERRLTFVALARSSGEDVVPYLRELVNRPSWLGQRAKVELGVLAAGALGEIATPAAREVLEAGKQRLQSDIRKACAQALERAARRRPGASGGAR